MSIRHSLSLKILAAVTTVIFSAHGTHAQTPALPAAPVAGTPPVAAGAPGAGAPAATPPAVAAPRPFREIVKDAKEIPGYFMLYQKDEKIWLAIKPDQFDKLFFFSYNIPQSVGERGLYGSQMGGSKLVTFHRIGTQIQLIAKNLAYYADAGSPQAEMVTQAFSNSLLASAPTVSAPHPENKAVLVDASALLFTDIPGYLTQLEAAFRMPFALLSIT